MAMTIASFEKFCKSYGNESDNTRIVLGKNETIAKGDADAGLLGRKVGKGGVSQAEENNQVRTALMKALREAFNGKIPDSVQKALVGSSFVGGSDMSTGKNGEVDSGRPLTMRRIKAVVAAATAAIGEVEKKERETLTLLKNSVKEVENYTHEGDFFYQEGKSLMDFDLTVEEGQTKMIAQLKCGAEKVRDFLDENNVDELSLNTSIYYLSILKETDDVKVSVLGKVLHQLDRYFPVYKKKIRDSFLPVLNNAIKGLQADTDSRVRSLMSAIYSCFEQSLSMVDPEPQMKTSEAQLKQKFEDYAEKYDRLTNHGKSKYAAMRNRIYRGTMDSLDRLIFMNLSKGTGSKAEALNFRNTLSKVIRASIMDLSLDIKERGEAMTEILNFLKDNGKWEYLKPENESDYPTEESRVGYLGEVYNSIYHMVDDEIANPNPDPGTEIMNFKFYEGLYD